MVKELKSSRVVRIYNLTSASLPTRRIFPNKLFFVNIEVFFVYWLPELLTPYLIQIITKAR